MTKRWGGPSLDLTTTVTYSTGLGEEKKGEAMRIEYRRFGIRPRAVSHCSLAAPSSNGDLARSQPKEPSLVSPSFVPPMHSQNMTITPDTLALSSKFGHSLSFSSHLRTLVPHLSPNHLPSRELNSTFFYSAGIAHLSYAKGRSQLPPPYGVQDRDLLFHTTHSRVLRFYDLPPLPSVFLHSLFLEAVRENKSRLPIPKSLWARRAECAGIGSTDDGVWAVFGTHEEARSALTAFGAAVSISPALESDLEPLHTLQKIQFRAVTDLSMPTESPITTNDLASCDLISKQMGSIWSSRPRRSPDATSASASGITLSSNPPSPRNVFRLGDWMCPSPSCAAHNFGRNFTCIGCGCPRPSTSHVISRSPFPIINSAQVSSPRFAGAVGSQMPASLSHRIPHVLTPSGRAFSVGGRVQNVSSDPLFSCFLFWPDNEPLPEQGQIRPGNIVGVPHPPILNTGNRGPIEHQPGDWVCKKCGYHNWRRRKVCQTCYPYAEGNGDSIPAAVQADRIKRLRDALTTTLSPSLPPIHCAAVEYPSQSPFAHIQHSNDCFLTTCRCRTSWSPALPSRDQAGGELGSRHSKDTIYQTSTPVSLSYRETVPFPIENASGHFLPSCLQDVVQSPSLSPTSTTSADLSVDEYIASPVSVYSTGSAKLCTSGDTSLPMHRTPSSVSLGLGNIWQLDGEESKAFSSSFSPQNETSRI
ncbi:hypothetical protein BC827DRAFT_1370586 [Russula dissimulans]|nr:hypothetical protein BC827DRAFT_1370586 [Russula dissimulans]